MFVAEPALHRRHLGDVQGAAAGPAKRPAQVRALPPQPADLHASLPGMDARVALGDYYHSITTKNIKWLEVFDLVDFF